jgi:hypothetical protein
MTPEQILAVKCAYADLLSAQEANNPDGEVYVWEAYSQTLSELVTAFPDIEFEPLEEDEIYSVSIEHKGNVILAEAYYQDGKWYTQGLNTEIQGKVTIV